MNNSRKFTIFICVTAILFGIIVKLFPAYCFYQGKNYLNKKNYIKAFNSLKHSYYFDKKNKDYRYYYVQSMIKLSPTFSIQKDLFEIASSDLNDSAEQLADSQISKWRNNVLFNIGDNYIEQVPSEMGIVRWDNEKFPITYSIKNKSGIKLPDYYVDEIMKAFSHWKNASGFLKFQYTDKKADITIEIMNLPDNVCKGNTCQYVVGFTTPNIKGKNLHSMNIVLYAKDPKGDFFTDKELYNTILHELGHALGIMGHSYNSEDLMYMSTDNNSYFSQYRSSFQYLSSNDINTIKLLYKIIPDVTNNENIKTKGLIYAPIILGTSKEISLRKLKEAQNYIKNAPNLPGGYIDLGIAYEDLGKHKSAIKAMKKALELANSNEDKYMVNYNLATIYFNISDYNTALNYANQAKNLSDTSEVKELIINIKNKTRN